MRTARHDQRRRTSQPETHAALRQSSEGRRRMNSLATSIPDPGPPDSAQPGARYIPGSVSAELEDPSMLARYSTDDQQKMLQHAQELALRRPRSETLKPSNKAAKSRWGRAGNEVLKVYKEKQKEKQKEEFADKGESHPCVLHPQSSFRMKWDLSAMIFMIYCAFSIPYRVGFDEAAEGAMFVFENIIDMFFVADLGLNFRTGYTYKQEGAVEDLVEMKPSKIACKYAKTWFIVDSLSAIPLNLILLAIDVEQQNAKSSRLTRVPKMFRLMRQVRLLKLFRVVRLLKWMKYSNLLRVVLTERLGLSPMLQRFAMLLITASTVSHMFACIWHFIHISELDSALMEGFCMNATADDDGNCVTWWTAYAGGIDTKTLDTESTSVKYLISLYWAVTTLTTVGYGDILPVREAEIWYTICVMFAGVSFYAYIAANVNNLLSQLSSSDTEVTEKMDQLNSFMTRRKVQQRNPALAHKMRSYFNRFYRVNYGAELNEEDIIKEVNVPALRTEIIKDLYSTVIRRVPFLNHKTVGWDFITEVAPNLTSVECGKGDYIVRKGELANEIFFLFAGQVDVVYTDAYGEEYVLFHHTGTASRRTSVRYVEGPDPGDDIPERETYFGDVGSLLLNRHHVSYRAATVCHMYCICWTEEVDLEFKRRFHDVHNIMRDNAWISMERLKGEIHNVETHCTDDETTDDLEDDDQVNDRTHDSSGTLQTHAVSTGSEQSPLQPDTDTRITPNAQSGADDGSPQPVRPPDDTKPTNPRVGFRIDVPSSGQEDPTRELADKVALLCEIVGGLKADFHAERAAMQHRSMNSMLSPVMETSLGPKVAPRRRGRSKTVRLPTVRSPRAGSPEENLARHKSAEV